MMNTALGASEVFAATFRIRRAALRLGPFVTAAVLVALGLTTVPLAYAVQTIRITRINGVDVPPDEIFVPNPPNDFFDIEWEAVDTDCNIGVNGMVTNVDGVGQTSSSGSGFSGSVNLDQNAFPQSCRHSIQIVATFRRPGACGLITPSVTSVPAAFWSSPYKVCIGPPKACQEGAGQVGRPCDVATGKMYHEMTDLVIQGPLPITFIRRYDSQSTTNGSLGYGWRHSYSMRVDAGGGNREVFTDAEGRQVYFNRLSPGVWDDNRIDHLSLTQGTPPWRVTDKHKTDYDFDGSGKLTSIQDRNGNTLTFGYTGADLTSITDSFGRVVTLVPIGGRLQTLSAGARTVTYSYTADNLTRVDFPDSSFVTYEYMDPNEMAPKHNLTAARDSSTPTPHVIEAHTYYANDKVHTTQSDGGNYLYTLDYDTPAAGQTRVTNSLVPPVQTTYTLDNFSGLVKQSSGPGCTSCGDGGTNATLVYDTFLNVTDVTDGRGVRTHRTYDGKGNVLTRTEGIVVPSNPAIERTWEYTYDAEFSFLNTVKIPTVGSGACQTAHPKKIVTYKYRTIPVPNGDLMEEKIEGCDGPTFFTNITGYDYDTHGQLALVNGPRTDAVPDDATTYLYYLDGDPDMGKRGRLQRVTNALGHQTNYASHDGSRPPYDLFGNVRSVIDANDIETQYEYDPKDRVTSVTLPADTITAENQYDAVGNLHRVRLPNCVQTGMSCAFSLEYEYDTVNRLKEIHDAVGSKIIYTYDTEGNRIREEYQDVGALVHRFTNFKYDTFNRLQYAYFNATVPEGGGSIFYKYTYFNDGMRQTERDPMGHTTTFDYDELKRLKTVVQTVAPDTLTTTYGYDVQDNLSSVTDPNTYQTTYTSSDMGWRLSTASPDTGTATYGYDPAGNLTSSMDANSNASTRAYDSINRLTTVSYPANPSLNVTHSYDEAGVTFGIGRRTRLVDPSGTTAFNYDLRGFLNKEQKTIGGVTWTTQYVYDNSGNLKQVKYPTDEPAKRQGQADYTYDDAERVSTVKAQINGSTAPVADTFSYKPFGPRASMKFGNTLVDSRSYGTRYQLGTWTLGGLISYTHSFDDDLNLTNRTDNLPSPINRTYGYDEIHRLTTAVGPWGAGTACPGSKTYTYDKNGNRQCKGEGATPTTYAYAPAKNRLASETTGPTTMNYSYDLNGNTTGDGIHTYQYSQADRLATVDPGATPTASYKYDGDGRRAVKTAAGTTTNYFYDSSGRLLTEIVIATGSGEDYIYLQDAPIARVHWTAVELDLPNAPLRLNKNSTNTRLDWSLNPQAGNTYLIRRKQVVNPNDRSFVGSSVIATRTDPTQTFDDPSLADGNRYDYRVVKRSASDALYFFHTDHVGTPIAMTDGSPAFVWKVELNPFGDVQSLPSFVNNLRFPGQYFDSETGLHQNWFRDYSPKTGRYVEADPIGLLAGPNPFGYVRQNPARWFDRSGLYTEIIFWYPVGWRSSSFGHLSTNVNGANFSWGPEGWDKTYPTASAFAARNETFRLGIGAILNLTPAQEAKLVGCYQRERGPYSKFTNNCAQPVKNCLEEATGHDFSDSFFPETIEQDLIHSPFYGGSTYYPGPNLPRNWWEDAPWAW